MYRADLVMTWLGLGLGSGLGLGLGFEPQCAYGNADLVPVVDARLADGVVDGRVEQLADDEELQPEHQPEEAEARKGGQRSDGKVVTEERAELEDLADVEEEDDAVLSG